MSKEKNIIECVLLMLPKPILIVDELPNDVGDFYVYFHDDVEMEILKSNNPPGWFDRLHDKESYKKVIAGDGIAPIIWNGTEDFYGYINVDAMVSEVGKNLSENFAKIAKESYKCGVNATAKIASGTMYCKEEMLMLGSFIVNLMAANMHNSIFNMYTTPAMMVNAYIDEYISSPRAHTVIVEVIYDENDQKMYKMVKQDTKSKVLMSMDES